MPKYKHLDGKPLQEWFEIEIVTKNNTKYIYFHSRIHVNKVNKLNLCFSTTFTDQEILNDFGIIRRIHDMYGTDIYRTY